MADDGAAALATRFLEGTALYFAVNLACAKGEGEAVETVLAVEYVERNTRGKRSIVAGNSCTSHVNNSNSGGRTDPSSSSSQSTNCPASCAACAAAASTPDGHSSQKNGCGGTNGASSRGDNDLRRPASVHHKPPGVWMLRLLEWGEERLVTPLTSLQHICLDFAVGHFRELQQVAARERSRYYFCLVHRSGTPTPLWTHTDAERRKIVQTMEFALAAAAEGRTLPPSPVLCVGSLHRERRI
eukprot:5962916-Pleurochrysis_carterae.AAC.1